jgi:rSAM/selenodomain-associated transferase 2/rSAM/selenodomain-associated transferase 1
LNTKRPTLSVVIPTLNEASCLTALLGDLRDLGQMLSIEVVLADGGSRDGTLAIAEQWGARSISCRQGRGSQLISGADATSGSWFLFLHADSRVDADACAEIARFVSDGPSGAFAYLQFALAGSRSVYRLIEAGQRWRERLFGLVYGDQGLLLRRELYEEVGGYPDWPIMEDVGIVDRLKRVAQRIPLEAVITTSARRYTRGFPLATAARNSLLVTLFRAGVDPSWLSRWYRPQRSGNRTVIVFAKAPLPGRVKTRLAADVGSNEAVRIYRRMGRNSVDSLRGGPFRLIVYVASADEESMREVQNWLDPRGLEFRTQSTGDLGDRMAQAVREGLVDADSVCIVGTDIPDLDRATVLKAFSALEEADAVLGPATDGGYYLVALDDEHPLLFEDIPWSTREVLDSTLERAGRAGLSVSLLDPMTDVDRLADVPEDLMAR